MESPIPILPLPTPDAETEKLIRMKDEEVGGAWGRRRGTGPSCGVSHLSLVPTPPPHPPAKAHAGDVAEDEAADAGPVTPPQLHVAMDTLPVCRLALPTPGP